MQVLKRLVLIALVVAVASCQAVAGVETRSVDPILPGCELPATGPVQIRLANLVPSTDVVDVCIAPAGTGYKRPLYRGAGSACTPGTGTSPGLSYTDVTVPLSAPATSVDIRFVAAGQTCASPSLGEALGVSLATDAVTTIARIGGGSQPQQAIALREEPQKDATSTRIRLVNAAPGLMPLVMGPADSKGLPSTVNTLLVNEPASFGGVPAAGPAGSWKVDDRGYFVAPPDGFDLGVVEQGTTKALIFYEFPTTQSTTFTLFAIGDPSSNNKYPIRGLVCDDFSSVDGKSDCKLSQLPQISVTTWNVSLFGPNAPYESSRQSLLYDAIAKHDADVLCLVETSRQSDRDNIASAANPAKGGHYPFVYSASDLTLSTQFTDPTDQSGKTPTPPSTPPCAGVSAADLDGIYTCMESKCDTNPGDPNGSINGSTDCLSTNCAAKFIDVLNTAPACFDCIIDYVESGETETFAKGRTACTSDSRPPMAFEGQNPMMMLSKYPLSNQDIFVLPSTNFRRAILYAQVQLEDQSFDFFCGFFSSPLIDQSLPYDGLYGNGDNDHGYDNEQLLQADKLIKWVNSKSGNRPAIITGDWHSSVASMTDGGAASDVADLNPMTIQNLRGAFTQATPGPSLWTPECTDCPAPANIYNGNTAGLLMYETYLLNWVDNATTSQSVIFKDNVVPLPAGAPASMGPLSLYFGLNVNVLRPKK